MPQNNEADTHKWIISLAFVVSLFAWFRVLFLSAQLHIRLRAYVDVVFLIAIHASNDPLFFHISSVYLSSTTTSYLMVQYSIWFFSDCLHFLIFLEDRYFSPILSSNLGHHPPIKSRPTLAKSISEHREAFALQPSNVQISSKLSARETRNNDKQVLPYLCIEAVATLLTTTQYIQLGYKSLKNDRQLSKHAKYSHATAIGPFNTAISPPSKKPSCMR